MTFSERIGKKQVRQELQIDGMNESLRNCLWNLVYTSVLEPMLTVRHGTSRSLSLNLFIRNIWHGYFGRAIDILPGSPQDINQNIRDWFFGAEWYKIYDLLEFMVTLHNFDKGMFKYRCNDILQKEGSGYRFVGEEIVPIVDEIELQAIEQAIDCCSKHQFDGARKHFDSALEKLSDRPKPDYRNSIKESISAVESVCVIISGERNFERALKKLKDSIGLHPALEKGMSSIYGYTSDADGIRHAMIEESDCDLADAKYMLVSCSAFINYLIMKAGKAGLLK